MRVIIDSGASEIVLPIKYKLEIEEKLGLKTKYFSCSKRDTLPDLVFDIEGVKLALPAEYYVRRSIKKCTLNIGGTHMYGAMKRTIILGDVFLRAYYVHFDYGKAKIGFARAASPLELTRRVEKALEDSFDME